MRRSGVIPESAVRMSALRGPSRRTIASAPRPTGVAGATIVSNEVMSAECRVLSERVPAGRDSSLITLSSLGAKHFLGNDRHPFVEPVAARLGCHVRIIREREVHDAALDRRHGRQQLLAAVAAHAIGDFARRLLELLDALALERAAIELDVLLHFATDERLVGQN